MNSFRNCGGTNKTKEILGQDSSSRHEARYDTLTCDTHTYKQFSARSRPAVLRLVPVQPPHGHHRGPACDANARGSVDVPAAAAVSAHNDAQ